MSEPAFVDTNVILRAVLGDHPEHSIRAQLALAESEGSLRVAASTISEFVWVLGGPNLGHGRERITELLTALLDLPLDVIDRDVISRAVDWYGAAGEWNDCLVAAYAASHTAGRVLSFDRGMDRIPGVTRIEP